MNYKKIIATFFVVAFFSVKSFAQFTSTWAFNTTVQNAGAKSGTQQTNIAIGSATLGTAIATNSYSNTTGVTLQPPTDDWPTTPTNDWHVDFPLSPVTGNDAILTGLTFVSKLSGGSGNQMYSLAVQSNNSGVFVPFGTAQSAAGGGTRNINFGAFSKKIYSGNSYTIRLYIYAANSGTSKSRSATLFNVAFVGNTVAAGTQPSVTTASAIQTGKYTATATGVVTAGTYTLSSSGVVWGLTANPTVALATKTTNGPTTTGNINLANGGSIIGLTAGTNYNVRAYAISETDSVTYGANLTFTTDVPTKPSLTTNLITAITSIKATSGGVIIDSGGVGILEKGVCWKIGSNPTILDSKTMDGLGNAPYSSLMKILLPNTNYCVRAYAKNSIDVGYGNEVCFTTLAPEPIITTVTTNGQNSIPFGNVIVNNLSAIKTYTLSADALSPANGSITITAPTGFEISTTPLASNFSSSITINYTGSSIATRTIYVRFLPTQFGSYSGTITHTGGGATAVNIDDVTVTGFGIQNPGELTNAGTDFWTGFGYQSDMSQSPTDNDAAHLSIFVATGNQASTVVVDLPGIAGATGFPITYTIPANSFQEISGFPIGSVDKYNSGNTADSRLYFTGITNRGIHVYSTDGVPVSVWMYTYTKNNSAGASMIFPTNTWGTKYAVQSFGGPSNTSNPNAFFYVIAKDDNTTFEFTPTVDILDSLKPSLFTETLTSTNVRYHKNTTYTISLNKGQIFNAMGYIQSGEGLDLSGTTVKSLDCDKKIAVFGGNGRVLVNTPTVSNSKGSDNLVQQMFPLTAWGTTYLTAPTKTMENNLFRVFVQDASTLVWVNDPTHTNPLPATQYDAQGNFFFFESNTPNLVESSKPVSVIQFVIAGFNVRPDIGNGGKGDPEMIILSSVKQAISSATVYSANFKNNNTGGSYINIIIKNSGIASFKIDGLSVADTGQSSYSTAGVPAIYDPAANPAISMKDAFLVHPYDTSYSYAKIRVQSGISHTISSDKPFNAIAYGMSDGESYGYNAGTNIKPNDQFLSVNNTYPNITKDSVISTCLNNPFNYKVFLPYKPLSMHWNFDNNPIQLPNSDTILVSNPTPVDSFISNGTWLYKYSLPTSYSFNGTGSFPVKITVNATNADGCSGLQIIPFNLKVVEPPVPSFLLVYDPCLPTILNFTDSSYDKNGYKMAGREWTFFGLSPDIHSTDSIPTIGYNNPGTYSIKLRAINSIGCYKDTTATVVLYQGPKVTSLVASSNGPDCVGKTITFTATATAALGTIIKYYWDFGDGKKDTTTTNTATHTYTTANNTPGYQVSVSVESSVGCVSSSMQIIQPIFLLKADFSLVSPQCVNVQANFTDASQGVAVSSPISAKWLWSFGDPGNNTSTAQNAQFTYTTDNTYSVKLKVALLNNGVEFCFDTITKPIVITPTITITSITATPGPINQGCANKPITYTAVGNTAAGAFKWYWDFGDGKKDTTTTNTTTHTFTSTATPFNMSVFAQLAGGCKGNTFPYEQYIYKVTAIPTFTSPQCINTPVVFTDNSTGTVTSALIDTKWEWTLQTGSPIVTTQNALMTYTSSGTYNIKLKTYLTYGAFGEFCSHDSTKTLIVNGVLTKPVVTVDNAATTLTSLTFNWAAVTNATGYQVSFNGGSWVTPSSGSTGLTHTATGLTNNTNYTICVKALGACPSDSACASGKTTTPNSDVFIPNTFTPDGNGLNDKLIVCSNNIKSVQFAVYSQWGEKLYETTNPTINTQGCYEVWDGKAFGKLQPVGVYAYVSTVVMNDGKVISKKGLINLIR